MKKPLLISACLLGAPCKYSGGSNVLDADTLSALRERYRLVPVCPEVAGGLSVPREPSEWTGERVVSRSGRDVTEAYRRGAAVALALCKRFSCDAALLKERSPSCGSGRIYDGSFNGTLVNGDGVAAALLQNSGVSVVGESGTDELLK